MIFTKRFSAVFAVLVSVLLAITVFVSCDETADSNDADTDEGRGYLFPIFVDWQDSGFKKEHSVYSGTRAGDQFGFSVPNTKNGYTLYGIYTEKNGQGEQLCDGNLICHTAPQKGETYYAYWGAKIYSLSFRFANDNSSPYTFTDGSKRVCKLYSADTPLDFCFPEITGDPMVSYWKCNNVRISDGNVLYGQYRTVSDLLAEGDTDFINIYPVFETRDYTVTLTLDYGNRIETVDLTYGDSIKNYLITYTQDGRELVGWTADRYDEEALIVDPAPIKEDKTLYAVWRKYADVTLYGVDENYFADGYVIPSENSRESDPFCFKRIYEYRPEYLSNPKRDGYVFAGWYATADFSGEPVSRLVSMEYNGGESYYARWVPCQRTVYVRYNTGTGTQTVKVVLTVDETMRLKADLSALPAPLGMKVIRLLRGRVPCTDEDGYWIDGIEPSPNYTDYYGAEVG